MERVDLSGAADAALGLVRAIDGYIERAAPFKLAKDPTKRSEVGSIPYNCTETLRIASLLLWPFMPTKIEELWRRLGSRDYGDALSDGSTGELADWATWGQLKGGHLKSFQSLRYTSLEKLKAAKTLDDIW